jgi:hypothetical protein
LGRRQLAGFGLIAQRTDSVEKAGLARLATATGKTRRD